MPAPLIPAERLRDALQVVRQSIEQFSANYRTWLTQAPSYSTGPSLVLSSDPTEALVEVETGTSDPGSSQSNETVGSGAAAADPRRRALRPDAETLSKAYCPIAGPRWDEHRAKIVASTAIKGLTQLRNQIDAELATLEKTAAENGNWHDPHPFSNGPHHIHYWEEVLYLAFTSGPVVSIQDRFSFDMDMAVRRRKRKQRSQAKAANSHSCKVDVVSRGGDKWTRLYITKFERLRAEFREAESYMVESDGDSDEDAEGPTEAGGVGDGGADPGGAASFDRDPAMDSAARSCSLMKTIRELRAAADTEAEARVQRSADSGRPNVFRPIEVELVVTRIYVEAPEQQLPLHNGKPFYEQDEAVRFQARLRAILGEAERIGVKVVFGFRRLPTELFGRFEYPSVAIYGSDLPIGLPKVPELPAQPDWKTTRKINLDVTALIALVSDTTHGIFEDVAPRAAANGGGAARLRAYRNDNGSGYGDAEADPTFQSHFRTFSIRKEALEARAAELSLHADLSDEAAKAADTAASKEGRALAIQLERELTLETLFDAILEPILGPDDLASGSSRCRKVELHATVGAFDRLRRVSSTVGGVNEKRRVAALLGDDGTKPEDFWHGSKWAGPEHARLRACLQLPVRPLLDLGPGGFESAEDLAQMYPDLARQHFISHMVDTLESCLTELWGSEWRDISEDLPRSKYKKLKQHSIHQAGGQTYTTLRSMHACARYGMTTLTSNMDSIQWLLKEMNRRPYSAKTEAILHRAKSQDIDVLFSPRATYEACFFLLHPRSLSEQMRVTSTAPPWREVLAGYPGGTGTPRSETETEPEPEIQKIPSRPDAFSHGEVYESVYGYELPTLSHEPAVRSSSFPSAVLASRSTDDVFHIGTGAGPSAKDDADASGPSFDRAESSGASQRHRPFPVTHKSSLSTVLGDENTALAIETLGPGPSAAVSENKWKRSGRRAKEWIGGPKHPTRLRIKHYRWWPFASLERFWLRFTGPVAWTDPLSYGRSSFDRESDADSNDEAGLPGPRGLSADAFGWQAKPPSSARLGYRWFDHLLEDLKLNRLHWFLLCFVYVAWILGFGFIVDGLWYNASVTGPDGVARDPNFFSCTSTYWLRNGGCGINGQDCGPFTTGADLAGTAFRCPSGCSSVTLLNPRTVGDQQVNYVPLVVGGGDAQQTYRADSFVCAAAIHAGVIRESRGGCGSLRLVGAYADYNGSSSHGLDSIGFDSTFPSSFRFESISDSADCTDRRWQLYILDAIMSAFVGLILRPKRIVWFWTLACLGYWHINMASEPRGYPPPVGEAIGDFLPFLFGCYVIWRVAIRFVWPAFERLPLEREVLTLGLWWIGVMMNFVFQDVPLSRLTAHDISQQPGALTSVIVIVVVVVVLGINQVLVIRKTGYLPKYLTLYIVGGILVGLAAAVPGETLRLHHYIIALVLLPACAFPTRLSLLYVALLLGMYTNGVARWGFDGLLQDVATVQGDATGGTGRPTFSTNSSNWAAQDGVVRWDPIPDWQVADWSGFNLLVDDVLRYQGSGTSFNLSSLPELFASQAESETDAGTGSLSNQTIVDAPHYLRIAFTSDASVGDYTRSATAFLSNGTWIDPLPGAT